MPAAIDVKSNTWGLYVALRSIVLYAGILCVGFYVDHIILWFILWIVGAFLFSTFFSLLHWSIHYSLFRTSILNDIFGRVFATLSLDIFSYYKYWHYIHHDLTNEEGDAEGFNISSIRQYAYALFRYFFNHITRFEDYYVTLYKNTENRRTYVLARKKEFLFDTVLFVAWVAVIAYCTYQFPIVLVKGYFMPMFFSLPILFFLDLAEHYGTEHGAASPYRATRTITGNVFTRFLTVYSNYHLEHHLHPTVSFFHMPTLRTAIDANVQFKESSYFAFHVKLLRKLLTGKSL